MLKTTATTNPRIVSCEGDGNQDRQEVHNHQEGYNNNGDEDKESPCVADKEKKGNEGDISCLVIVGKH